MNDLRVLASGAIMVIAPDGLASFTTCAWLVEGMPAYNPDAHSDDEAYDYAEAWAAMAEDGPVITECGARMRALNNDPDLAAGYTCDAGHQFVPIEVRVAQGWDYAECPEEAKNMREHGVEPRDLVTGGAFRG